jgi:hypothetical protein
MNKSALIVLLVGVNLFLLSCLILTAYTPPAALAAEVSKSAEGYLLFSAEAERQNEAVYLLDTRNHQLHAFRTNFPRIAGGPTAIAWLAGRDLMRDFRLPERDEDEDDEEEQ